MIYGFVYTYIKNKGLRLAEPIFGIYLSVVGVNNINVGIQSELTTLSGIGSAILVYGIFQISYGIRDIRRYFTKPFNGQNGSPWALGKETLPFREAVEHQVQGKDRGA